jgi:hypothetical protein
MTIVVFAGPSLPPVHRPACPGIEWRPPLRMGDLYRAAIERPDAIGVVDGVFEVVPTVWHKEILWAMAQGIHVFGAASIGALRAAELAPFGMVGVGWVYQAFRDGTLIDDDEVALLHGPEDTGYAPVTEAMVNVRATIEAAAQAGFISPIDAARVTAAAKALFYKDRDYAGILRSARAHGVAGESVRALETWLPTGRIDRKRQDAMAMVDTITAAAERGLPPLAVDYRFNPTAAWEMVRRPAAAAGLHMGDGSTPSVKSHPRR